MTLLLDNADVERLLTVDTCLEALETAFRDYAEGRAVNRPRSHTYTALGDGHHYLFKSMDGSLPRYGVHAIRLSSDHIHERIVRGRRRREKLPLAPGGRYVGLVLLFDIRTLEPLAIIHDGALQRLRVGCTSALAARYLARPEAAVVGLIGSGWQAGAQLLALERVRPIREYRAYSTDPERLGRFCAEMSARLGKEVRPVRSAREAVEGADIVACATNSHDPVLDGDWLVPGQHVGSVQGHELDRRTLERASLIVVRSREEATYHHAPGQAPVEAAERKRLDPELARKTVELGEVVTGRAGRRSPADLTLFTGGGTGASAGLGIQFAAVGYAVYRAARAAGAGRELPTEWFLETAKP
ncbi:MAG TPA: ornithine cyclodeaminase family protein [Thermodesulfobacteriota bacterium]|nr:ornithine cyclodeaminase family protein [Thermodesulfobacteriota bacterium]